MRVKKISILIMAIVLIISACKAPVEQYVAGVYRGVAEGYHSRLVIDVTTDAFSITNIDIIEEDETPIIAEIVYAEIPKAVIKANSINVDVVAGASYTSEKLLNAIEDGLSKARIQKDDETETDKR